MARLTILQASQQGFGSTLTIHRHIKDGSLPVYEEGDVKLLEVDDLISVLGEPGTPINDNLTPTTEPENIDIYEYNRMKLELEQKNKKNMWLAADLAEVVRELKEKEAKFEAERTRLLKVLEQAQALLLREAKRAGGTVNKADVSALKLDQAAAGHNIGGPPEQPPQPEPQYAPQPFPVEQTGAMDQPAEVEAAQAPAMPDMPEEKMWLDNGGGGLSAPIAESESSAFDIPSQIPTLEQPDESDSGDDAPGIVIDDEAKPKRRAKSRRGVNAANPMVPPFEEGEDEPKKSRLLGTATWIFVVALVGGAAVFFRYRAQVMSSIANIVNALSGG